MDAYTIIRDAILNKDSVAGWFDGFDRQLSPHIIGTNKQGRRQALFYQYGGGSKSGLGAGGSRANWRCIPVDEMRNVSTISGVWHTADEHGVRPQTCVVVIEAVVAY